MKTIDQLEQITDDWMNYQPTSASNATRSLKGNYSKYDAIRVYMTVYEVKNKNEKSTFSSNSDLPVPVYSP